MDESSGGFWEFGEFYDLIYENVRGRRRSEE